jgi:glycosyltransferase involved in cell wall biosynthesis
MTMGLLSIIIPTYNRTKSLEICIGELEKQINHLQIGQNVEIIVSNDFEENNEFKSLKKAYSSVKFINGPKKGPASNRNFAASNAQNEWLLFIDDDCIPDRNILNEYFSAIKSCHMVKVFEVSIIEDRT